MSRHRNIRSMNYSEEYEGFDDVYGHSVEDDHCISPSEARFLYDRTRHPQMSAFINEDNYIAEEDESNAIRDQHVTELEKCNQVAVDEDKLRLCLDDIQNVIGDIFPQSTVKEIVIRYNYDVNKCLDHILSETSGNVSIEQSISERDSKIKGMDTGGGDGPGKPNRKFVIPKLKNPSVENVDTRDSNISVGNLFGNFSSLQALMDHHQKASFSLTEQEKETETPQLRNIPTNSPSTLAEFSKSYLTNKKTTTDVVLPHSGSEMETSFMIPKLRKKNLEMTKNKNKWLIDLSSALKTSADPKEPLQPVSNSTSRLITETAGLPEYKALVPCSLEDDLDSHFGSIRICSDGLELTSPCSSPFGKILCRKWKCNYVRLNYAYFLHVTWNLIKGWQFNIENTGLKIVTTQKRLKNDEKLTKEVIPEPEVPSITIISSGTQTKGFEIANSNKANLTVNYPKCQSPVSGRASPSDAEESCKQGSNDRLGVKSNILNRDNKTIDVAKHYKKDRGDSKEILHMVVIGHVDAGKSTLMGHLLYALGEVNKKTLHKYEQESRKIGKQSFVYAWILDETGEERSRGITMDVGQAKFETKTKMINLLDAPGHKDFIPNMITGATQADVAVLVVDATRGEFETGFESGGQTREHALLVRSLGVTQLAVIVNKLDTVGWSEDRFKEISSKLGVFLKQAGYRESDVIYVPCSGLAGENLIERASQDLLTSWYNGPCLLEVIDNFRVPERPLQKPLRISVSDVYKGTGSGFCVTGHIETGMVQLSDKVLVMPQNELAQVKGITIDESPVQAAYAGDGISLTLANYDIQHMNVGYILCDPTNSVPATSRFEARIVVFNISTPITTGYPVVMHIHSLAEQAVVVKLVAQLNKTTGEVVKKRPRCLMKNSNAVVEIETTRPICLELYRETKELGRFMLRVGGISIAAGMVTKLY
ncbi:hypothetical protein RUM43_008333 [Polyplax serrata]|uniref:Tr-type G domain-containing protein n=1 Tax=Polyplax serrata TaxID=468196 RepID=A0AAN8PNK2_POLSC